MSENDNENSLLGLLDKFAAYLEGKGKSRKAVIACVNPNCEFVKFLLGQLPRTCMNEKEVFQLLQQPQLNHDPLVTRNKAMLELLFSTGIRSNELCSFNLEDIDHQNEMVRINTPRGGSNYQRIIPVGKVALEYLTLYLNTARPALENGDAKALFISYAGHRLRNDAVLLMVKKYAHECGFRKNITTHSLRVTCATLMLRNGADIRYVQEQLGHKKITST